MVIVLSEHPSQDLFAVGVLENSFFFRPRTEAILHSRAHEDDVEGRLFFVLGDDSLLVSELDELPRFLERESIDDTATIFEGGFVERSCDADVADVGRETVVMRLMASVLSAVLFRHVADDDGESGEELAREVRGGVLKE